MCEIFLNDLVGRRLAGPYQPNVSSRASSPPIDRTKVETRLCNERTSNCFHQDGQQRKLLARVRDIPRLSARSQHRDIDIVVMCYMGDREPVAGQEACGDRLHLSEWLPLPRTEGVMIHDWPIGGPQYDIIHRQIFPP